MEVILLKDFKDAPKDKNYLVWRGTNSPKFFSFGDYKTVKKFGVQQIPVPSKLNSVINTWLKFRSASSGKYLLTTHDGKKMSKNYLTQFLKKTFSDTGKKISVNMIRHIYLSKHYEGETSWDSKKKLATQMAHSVPVALGTYVKVK